MKASAAIAGRIMLMGALVQGGAALAEDVPLHAVIDQRLTLVAGLQPQRSSDAEFLRRVSLDLVGMPPTSDEARAFLADPAVDKRERLIDRLFASPHFVRHLAAMLDLMLMERRAYTNVTIDEWQAWLVNSVRQNKPWNVMVREILQADGEAPAQRPPARFFLDRATESHLLTRDIGRIFFGRDMQCAQCHDHPLVNDYLQSDYHGLLAFVSPTYPLVRKEGDKQTTLQAEKSGTELAFESVFVHTPRRTGARLPDGVAIDEPFYLPGEDYQVPPADGVKSVPKFSRRAKLAELATSGTNQAFNRNIANRLWAHMFGRGLVHPVDMQHPENPAADPELLKILGERFAAMNFDIRGFLREIALSGAYQRAFDLPGDMVAISAQAAVEANRLQAEREALKQTVSASDKAYRQAVEAWETVEAPMLPMAAEFDAARTKCAEARQKVDEALKAANDAKAQFEAKQSAVGSVEQAATAAKQAAQALAEDKELAEAAQKIQTRSGELVAEVAALAKSVEEKSAAIQPPTEAWNSTKPAVDEARSKVTPLSESVKQAERAMLAARTQAASDAELLAAVDRRVETVQGIAQLGVLRQAIVTASASVPTRELELAAADKELGDYAAVIADNQAKLTSLSEPTIAERARREQVVAAAQNVLAAARAEVAAKQSALDAAAAELTERWTNDFSIASLKPLTPEHLCWSVFRVTGVYDRYWQTEVAELDKTKPLTEEQKQDPAQLAARDVELEQRTYDKLKSNIALYVMYYGAAAGQPQGDFFSTADQALFVENGGSINSWVAPAGDNVTERVAQQSDPRAAAEELYLAVLTRLPTEEEAAEVVAYVGTRGEDKNGAAQELVWGLLNSAEFRFNH